METKEIVKTIITILVIVSLGLFATNQYFAFTYKVRLINAPCSLCIEEHPEVTSCIQRQYNPNAIPINLTVIVEEG